MRSKGNEDPERQNIDKLIRQINGEYIWEARQIRGKDLNDHFQQIMEWEAQKEWDKLLDLYEEIIPATHRLAQYDAREPQSYWPMKAATLYLRRKRPDMALKVLTDWLNAWPPERGEKTDRAVVRARITRIMNKHY